MKKKLPVVTVAPVEEADRLAGLPFEATIALAEVAGALKDGLLAFASATGLVVMRQMMEAELTGAIGEKHAKIPAPQRVGNWHGNAKGSVVLGGRQVSTERPRGRSSAGEEIGLDTWKAFSSADLLNSLVVERMLAGVATRRHYDVAEPVGAELEADHPDAAASLREGLDDMFTVRRLGVGGTLAATLTTTNCIESMISIAKRTTRRVTKWKDGSMKKRWVAAGMLEAERSFRRVRGHKDMATLIAALGREVAPVVVTPEGYDEAAA